MKIINNGRNKSERGRGYEAGRENGRPGDLDTERNQPCGIRLYNLTEALTSGQKDGASPGIPEYVDIVQIRGQRSCGDLCGDYGLPRACEGATAGGGSKD